MDSAPLPQPSAPLPPTGTASLSALAVGTEPGLVALARSLLREADLEQASLTTVASLHAALDLLSIARPSVIFLALDLPDADGINALVWLQGAAPGIPVVPLPVARPCGLRPGTAWTAQPGRRHRLFDRAGAVDLLRQVALLDQGNQQLFFLATHDRLTGLANRWLLEERLKHALARSRRSGIGGALLFVDLDGFKAINDRYGHDVGDRVLVAVAERLGEMVRAGDTVARWGGDEFAILLESIGHRDLAYGRAREISERLAEPTAIEGAPSTLRASVGTALFPEDGEEIGTLLVQADRRMYRAKGHGALWSVLRRVSPRTPS